MLAWTESQTNQRRAEEWIGVDGDGEPRSGAFGVVIGDIGWTERRVSGSIVAAEGQRMVSARGLLRLATQRADPKQEARGKNGAREHHTAQSVAHSAVLRCRKPFCAKLGMVPACA